MMARAAVAFAAAIATSSCAAPLMKLPAGPGTPASDATDVAARALRICQNIKTITAEIGISGSVGRRRLRARLLTGLAAPASAYLEAPAPFGAPVFIFAATGDDATLLLPRDRRVLEHGQPSAVLEAIAGVPVGPQELRAALTGCAAHRVGAAGEQVGEQWRVIRGEETLYLYREHATDPWRLVAAVHGNGGGWRAEYRDFVNDLPHSVRLISTTAGRFDLRLSLSQVEVDVPLAATTFTVRVPPDTAPLTLEELRDAGPLAER